MWIQSSRRKQCSPVYLYWFWAFWAFCVFFTFFKFRIFLHLWSFLHFWFLYPSWKYDGCEGIMDLSFRIEYFVLALKVHMFRFPIKFWVYLVMTVLLSIKIRLRLEGNDWERQIFVRIFLLHLPPTCGQFQYAH